MGLLTAGVLTAIPTRRTGESSTDNRFNSRDTSQQAPLITVQSKTMGLLTAGGIPANPSDRRTAPSSRTGVYTAIAAGFSHTCAITS